ncbi:flagellar motor switch protein FliM [Novosphingobium barchaimii LL02]|uniref:Flagellar motor switch protein FliM n=1 Tax=Novosphingobium barchaimii LL02 TaxID=1114963 RepID=A0A0J7XKW9_9SPHN|nr:flagellar motor switch protein FliM [Novosphingobium barchaimii]KMS52641.1 flagellar motor switch protein FliM [Novosphingobium barchaimii LL02]
MTGERDDPASSAPRPETIRLAAVDGDTVPRRGLKAVLESNVISHERLPMLEVVCERMVRNFATSMRNLTSDAIDVNLEAITSVRFGDFMGNMALPSLFGVFQVKPWESYGVVTVDAGLIYAIVDALLGGRGGTRTQPAEARSFTTIEMSLVSRVVQMALDDLASAFEEIAAVTMGLERMESSPRFAAIAEPSNAAAVASYSVSMEGGGGVFSILLPYATIEPVRDKLLQRFMGEKLGRDHIWSAHMASELYNTEVTVDVVLGEKMMSLREVRSLVVGQTIALSHSPEDALHVHCGGVPLGRAHIGQRSSNIAIRMATDISKGYPK